jgi:hypothetical protein
MAINQTAYVDLLVKKLLGVAKTDLPGNKSPGNESIASPLLNRGDKTWTQAANIPTTAAAVANIVQAYTTTSLVECTGDNTTQTVSSVYPTWKTGLTNWVPPEFDTVNGTNTYRVAVYYAATGAAASFPTGFTQIFADGSGGTGEYHFDYQAGTVNFIGGTIPSGMSASSRIYVVGYRYIGLTGVTNLPSITLGTGGAQGTLTTNGAYNLLLNTNAGTNSGTITIAQGVNGNISLTPNGTGNVVIGGHPTLEGVTATGATGTGKIVFDTAPTFTTSFDGTATFGAFASVTALTVGYTGTGAASTTNIGTAALTGAFTKTINIGTGGTTGSTTAINIGSATNGTTTINGAVSLHGTTSTGATGTGAIVFGTAPTLSLPSINNIKTGYTTTATAAGTTTLTSASNYYQLFTGVTTQTVVLPVTSTLTTGMSYEIENNSTGNITVNSSGGNLVGTVLPGTTAHLLCIGTAATTAADWDFDTTAFTTLTGTGSAVLNTSPSFTTSLLTPVVTTSGATSLVLNTNSNAGPGASITLQSGTNSNVNLAPSGTGTVDASSKRITNVADPTQSQDAATKAYVDATSSGLDIKSSVRLATTANLSATASGTGIGKTLTNSGSFAVFALDGITAVSGDRVLIKNQSTAANNGIYTVTTVGTVSTNWVLTRATDADNTPANEVNSGMFAFVEEGSTLANTGWVLSTTGAIVLDTTSLAFTQFSGAGTYLASGGLQLVGNTFSVNLGSNSSLTTTGNTLQVNSTIAGNGLTYTTGVIDVVGTLNRISVTADAIDIASTYVGQTSITTLGTLTSGTWNATAIAYNYGGTGFTSYAKGDIVYASAANTLSKLTAGTDGQVLQLVSGAPAWADIDGGTY